MYTRLPPGLSTSLVMCLCFIILLLGYSRTNSVDKNKNQDNNPWHCVLQIHGQRSTQAPILYFQKARMHLRNESLPAMAKIFHHFHKWKKLLRNSALGDSSPFAQHLLFSRKSHILTVTHQRTLRSMPESCFIYEPRCYDIQEWREKIDDLIIYIIAMQCSKNLLFRVSISAGSVYRTSPSISII